MSFSEEDYLLPFELRGLKLRNQFVVASGPASKNIGQLLEAERCGWGAASIKLATEPAPYINREPRYRYWKREQYHAFSAEKRLTLEQALRLVEEGRKRTRELVILANFSYTGDRGMDGWVEMARKFEAAGAHALELNMCCPNMSFNLQVSGADQQTPQSGASLGQNAEVVGEATRRVVEAVGVPVVVKLTPEGGRIAEVAAACFRGGAAAAGTTANRLAVAEFDINAPERGPYRLQVEPSLACFSGKWIKPLALRDVYEMRHRLGPEPCLLGTGGICDHVDSVQMMMCGADLVGICTEVMLHGFEILPRIVRGVKRFMAEHGYSSYRDFRDRVVGAVRSADRLTLVEGHARVDPETCTGCTLCTRIGHCHAISMRDGKAVVDEEQCTGCTTCVDVCPAGAVSVVERKRGEQ